jgi:hypothetical protein
MVRSEVVEYLREHLSSFSEEDLRRQLSEEGVSETDFNDCLAVARINPRPATVRTVKKTAPSGDRRKTLVLAAAVGSPLLLLLGILMLLPAKTPSTAAVAGGSSTGESAFIGHAGWVVRLPRDYAAVRQFNDAAKTDELVYFCPRGTDQTNFIDEELFGQLGIVRVEAAPSEFAPTPAGIAQMTRRVSDKLRNDKFLIKPLQVGTLPGIQVNVQSPFPRVEAYLLGQNEVYFFYAGQEDEIWRAIVLSLRDAHSEN